MLLENAKVIALAVFELVRENQQRGKITLLPTPRLGSKNIKNKF